MVSIGQETEQAPKEGSCLNNPADSHFRDVAAACCCGDCCDGGDRSSCTALRLRPSNSQHDN